MQVSSEAKSLVRTCAGGGGKEQVQEKNQSPIQGLLPKFAADCACKCDPYTGRPVLNHCIRYLQCVFAVLRRTAKNRPGRSAGSV